MHFQAGKIFQKSSTDHIGVTLRRTRIWEFEKKNILTTWRFLNIWCWRKNKWFRFLNNLHSKLNWHVQRGIQTAKKNHIKMAAYGVMREEYGGITVHSLVSCHTYIWTWDEANKHFIKIIIILREKNVNIHHSYY